MTLEITEVRIKLMEESEDRLRAFCSITFDYCFVVRDLKIIQGNNGPFVAMPSRKLTGNCRKCGTKNHLKANYCNQCGAALTGQTVLYDSTGRAKLYADIAHPVNARCREMIQNRIIKDFNQELELSAQPGYQSRYDDDYFDDDFSPEEFSDIQSTQPSSSKPLPDSTETPETGGSQRLDESETVNPAHRRPNDPSVHNQSTDADKFQP